MKSIHNAYKNEQNDVLQHLHKISALYINQVGANASDINKILKSSGDTNRAFNTLQKNYNCMYSAKFKNP